MKYNQLTTRAMLGLASLAITTTMGFAGAAPAAVAAAKGFYIGFSGGVGVGSLDYKQDGTVSNTANTNSVVRNAHNFGAVNGIFGVVFGYNFQKGNFVFGLDINAGYDATNQKLFDNTNFDPGTRTSKPDSYYFYSLNYKKGLVASIAPRLGFLITPTALVYIRLGAEYSKNTLTLTPYAKFNDWYPTTGTPGTAGSAGVSDKVVKQDKNAFNFAPGLGIEVYKNKVFLRAEYVYSIGAKIQATHDLSGISDATLNMKTGTHALKTPQHQFKIALGYKF